MKREPKGRRDPLSASAEGSFAERREALYGPLVKRLRHRPLTPVTRVRFPHGSPKI